MSSSRTAVSPRMSLERLFIQQPIDPAAAIGRTTHCFLVGFDVHGGYHLYHGMPGHITRDDAFKSILSDDPQGVLYTTPRGVLYAENRIVPHRQPVYSGADVAKPCQLIELLDDQRDMFLHIIRGTARGPMPHV